MVTGSKELERSSDKVTKRKGPPEFRHLPRDRAKQLKKQWIEKKKIKAQWKQEKKKENITTKSTNAVHDTEGEEPQMEQAVSADQAIKDSKDSGDPTIISPPIGSSKNTKRKQPEVVAETRKVLEKAPQIDRTTQRTTVTNRNRKPQSTGFQSKKEMFTGKRQRPVTMRERMGSLLEKIQKNHGQGQ